MSYACPYSDEVLDRWDGVSNPMGKACNDCENYECEHNPNPDPSYPEFDPYEETKKEVDFDRAQTPTSKLRMWMAGLYNLPPILPCM